MFSMYIKFYKLVINSNFNKNVVQLHKFNRLLLQDASHSSIDENEPEDDIDEDDRIDQMRTSIGSAKDGGGSSSGGTLPIRQLNSRSV